MHEQAQEDIDSRFHVEEISWIILDYRKLGFIGALLLFGRRQQLNLPDNEENTASLHPHLCKQNGKLNPRMKLPILSTVDDWQKKEHT